MSNDSCHNSGSYPTQTEKLKMEIEIKLEPTSEDEDVSPKLAATDNGLKDNLNEKPALKDGDMELKAEPGSHHDDDSVNNEATGECTTKDIPKKETLTWPKDLMLIPLRKKYNNGEKRAIYKRKGLDYDENPYKCVECQMEFSQSSNLKAHLRTIVVRDHTSAQYAMLRSPVAAI